VERKNLNIVTNMHSPPAEGNFCDEHGQALKAPIVKDSKSYMGYNDASEHKI
jgi:hypothetical protein